MLGVGRRPTKAIKGGARTNGESWVRSVSSCPREHCVYLTCLCCSGSGSISLGLLIAPRFGFRSTLSHAFSPLFNRHSLCQSRVLIFQFQSIIVFTSGDQEGWGGGGEGGTKKQNAVYYCRTYLAIQDPVRLQPLLWDRGILIIEGHWYSGRSRIKEHCSVRPRCLFWYSYLPLCVSASTLISCSASSAFGLNLLM